ncbi:MAG: AsmA-like C-terminal region-containing protein [Thermodesulfobacteriota bacterium]
MSDRTPKLRRRILWAVPLALILLIPALVLLAPRLVSLESVRQKLTLLLQERMGVQIRFEGMELSYLPVPHLSVREVSIVLPGGGQGDAASITLYPRILSFLRGKARISRMEVDSPRLRILNPRGLETAQGGVSLQVLLAPLALEEPDLELVLRQGSVEVLQEGAPSLLFTELSVEMTLPPQGLDFRVSCSSNLWEEAVLDGRLDTKVLRGEGHLVLKGLDPGPLLEFFLPSSEFKVSESFLDLGVDFKMEGLQGVRAELQGAFSGMTLVRAGRKATLKSGRFNATAGLGAEGLVLSLKDLSLEEPRLEASGELALGGAEGGIKVRLEGRDVEISSARERILSLAGDDPDVARLFGMLRAGVVPGVIFESAAGTVSGLLDLENMVIAGRLEEGKIQVPDVALALDGVKGEATVSEGILEATSLEARCGNTKGRQGTLKLGLKGEEAPFRLDIQVEADLSEVPRVLKGLVTQKAIMAQLEKTRELQGRAKGSLVLGDVASDIRVRVELDEFSLSARYEGIPYPVNLRGGRTFYEGTNAYGRDIQCQVGKSSASGLSWNVEWVREPHMTAELGRGRISVEEILSWISSVEGLRGGLKGIDSLGGEVLLADTRVSGPLLEPAHWRFEVNGEIPDLHGRVESLPAPMKVTKGRFTADPQRLILKEVETRMMDTSLTVSGVLEGYMRGLPKADLTFRGEMGTQTLGDLTRFSWRGRPVHLRSALSIQPMRVVWNPGRSIGFSGQAAIQNGPTLTVDMRREPGQWLVNRALLEDQDSHADFSLRVRDPEMTLSFSGTLNEKTLDRIFPGYEFQAGWVKGDFQVHLVKDRLLESWARGRVEADDFSVLHVLPADLDIDEVCLKAEKRRVEVESLRFTWAKTRFSAAGSLEMKTSGIHTDLDFYSSDFEWQHVKPYLPASKGEVADRRNKEAGAMQEKPFGFPLLGSVRFHFERFAHPWFTSTPLKAEAVFSRQKVEAKVTEARVCGISTLGSVVMTPEGLSLRFEALSGRQEVLPCLECLTEGKKKATGLFDLRLELQGKGKAKEEELLSSLQGNLTFTALEGIIREHILFERVNHYLSLTGILRGSLESGKEGIPYDSIRVKARIQNGRCVFQEAVFDGVDLDAGFDGQVDLVKRRIDGRLLVAPFRTMNRIVNFIPVVRTIMGGTLVSVPIKVAGPLNDPKLTPLAPSAVGKSLLDMMKRTFSLPVQMFDPLIHKQEDKS